MNNHGGSTGATNFNAAQGRTVKHGVSRLLPYAPPWLIWIGTLVVASTGWYLWGSDIYIRPWYVLGAAGSTAFWVWFANRHVPKEPEHIRILILAGIALCGVYVIVSGILSPWQPVLLSLWGGVGFTVCVAWGIRRMVNANTEGVAQPEGNAAKLLEVLGKAKLGLPQVTQEGQVVVEGEIDRGSMDREEFVHITRAIEQITGMRERAGTVVKNPKDSGRVTLRFSPVDLLDGPVLWPGPLMAGQSAAAGVYVGMYDNMQRVHVHIASTAERVLVHWLVMGMPGAGKSQGVRMMVADLLTRKDVTVWAHDHDKGLQTLGPLLKGKGIDWVTMDKNRGKVMFAAAKRVVEKRARWLGREGYDQWEEGCGLNLLVVWVEEAAELGDLKVFFDLARLARSVGVVLILSMQRASHTVIKTDTRAMIAGNWCFGVESAQDTKFGLPEKVIDDGAAPEEFRADNPGYSYLAAPGIDREKQATKLKSYFATAEQLTAAVELGGAFRQPLDAVSVEAAGIDYANRIPAECFVPGHPRFDEVVGLVDLAEKKAANEQEEESDDEQRGSSVSEPDNGEDEEMDEEEVQEEREAQEQRERMKADVEFPECPENDFTAPPRKKPTREEFERNVQAAIREAHATGKGILTVPDIDSLDPPVGRGREIIRTYMKWLASGNAPSNMWRLAIDEDTPSGQFRIVTPE